jgi:hypothetical protein
MYILGHSPLVYLTHTCRASSLEQKSYVMLVATLSENLDG